MTAQRTPKHGIFRLAAPLALVLLLALAPATRPAAQPLQEQSKEQSNDQSNDQSQAKPAQQQPIPDAPSSSRPQEESPFPGHIPPRSGNPPAPPQQDAGPLPAPPSSQIREVRPGQAPPPSGRDELTRYVVDVQFVQVPVTVKDQGGFLVDGLLPEDFTVLEDGVPQPLRYFSSDPFPLSAAVVVDVGISENTLRRLGETYPALVGAFSPYDEITVFTYGNTVRRLEDFTASPERMMEAFRRVRAIRGRTGGPPITQGPLASGPPVVSGRPLDPGAPQPHMRTPPRESRVLNDAILEAALELARRDPTRRKILFVISDGREEGSDARYEDVLKVLLSNNISVFALAVEGGAIPGYRSAQRIRLPGLGHGNILPQYTAATGGQVFPELAASAIEQAYARVTLEARNQYTLGYNTRTAVAGNYRSIEVRVHRPNLRVFAKDGYYPLPPPR
jgi:VWFA-related protein